MDRRHDHARDGSARSQVRRALLEALQAAQRAGALPATAEDEPVDVVRPSAQHGDFATSLPMRLARVMRRPPMAIAEAVAGGLRETIAEGGDGPIGAVAVAAPGFVNVHLATGWVAARVDALRHAGPDLGGTGAAVSRSVNVEFVSANPTGPLTIGNARGAFTGDLLCRVLEAVGHQVTREYYFNDFNTQVQKLGESVHAVRLGGPVPEDGYHGEYVRDLAERVPDEVWSAAVAPGAEPGWILGAWASERVRTGIEASLQRLGVRFDVWKSERTLHEEGWVERAFARLREAGHLYEHEGATWFRSTSFGDDKDRVVIRSNGSPTYLAADVGYLAEKFSRGFDELIYIWGSDHHGTVARLRGAAEAMGYGGDRVQVVLVAWVRFVRDGREISMSKRAGEFITLDELLAEVGVDAARWYFASRAHTSGIDFDIELAKRQTNENPVYYVQYAHARISSILRKAAETGLRPADSLGNSLAGDEVALGLAKRLLRLPEIVEDAATQGETQGITAYATELATTFHAFYRDRRVVDASDAELSSVRLALVDATRTTLAATLGLLGISAPESM